LSDKRDIVDYLREIGCAKLVASIESNPVARPTPGASPAGTVVGGCSLMVFSPFTGRVSFAGFL
jgi:hypothetical protein